MPESGDFFGPLGLGDLETPEKRGRFINIEAIDAYIEKATMVDITVSGSSTLNDVTINNATIDNATITNADIDSLSYDRITSGTNPNTLTHSGDFVVSGSISLSGDLTMESTGVFATATSGARIVIDNSSLSAERMTLYTGATGEYNAAYIETTDLSPIDAATMYARGPDLGDATNGGYGEFTMTSNDASNTSAFDLRAYAIGNWIADTNISATAAGSGAATADLLASANTGNATVTITAGSNSGTADIVLSADQISIPDGTAAAPALTNTGNTNTGLYFSDTNEIAFSSGGTLAWRMKKVSDDSRLYTTESNDYMEYDNNTEEWAWYIDGTARLNVTAGVTYVGSTLFRIPKKTSTGDPTATDEGDMYVNTVDNVLKVYEGGSWRTVASW